MMPTDPFILLSWTNTQLRDSYASLAEMCAAEGVEQDALTAALAAIGMQYDEQQNRFW